MKLLASFDDTEYKFTKISKTRLSCRAVVLNEKGEVALTHLLADDKFGHRDYYELPGGGKKLEETPLVGAMREAKEELGVETTLLSPIGVIHDFYNLIEQENFSYYYMLKVTKIGDSHFEERESHLIDKIVWVPLSEAVEIFNKQLNQKGVGLLVGRREYPIITLAAKTFDKILYVS